MEDVDRVDNSSRDSKRRQSGQGIDSRCRWSKSRKTQTKQITHQGIADTNTANKTSNNAKRAQIVDPNRMSQ